MLEKLPAKNGGYTLSKNGVYLLSAYDPGRDALRLVPESVAGKFFVVFGECLGLTAEGLASRGCPTHDVFIVEPDEELRALLPEKFRNRSAVIDNLSSLAGELESALIRRLKPELIVVPSVAKAYPGAFGLFERIYRSALAAAVENIKVDSYFSRVWMLNFFRNLSVSTRTPSRFALDPGPASPLPAIVAAAGPSLARYLPELKKLRKPISRSCRSSPPRERF
jgi:hypothetical protein